MNRWGMFVVYKRICVMMIRRAMVDIFLNIHMYLFLGCWGGGGKFFWCSIRVYFWALFVRCSNPSLCSYGISSYKLDRYFFFDILIWFLLIVKVLFYFLEWSQKCSQFFEYISLQLLQIWSNHPRVVGKIGTTSRSKPIFLELR